MPLESIDAPLTGTVLKITVKAGDKVKEGDEICTLESMKMENSILSPVDGTVKEIRVNPGQVVKGGEVLAIIEY